MDLAFLAELIVNGALSGLMYSLVAMGIVMIYKASSVPNLAQGAMVMLSGYLVAAIADTLGLSMWVAVPVGALASFFAGFVVERVALRRLAGRPIVMLVMMTLALGIFLEATTLLIWGAQGRTLRIGIDDSPLFLGPVLLNRSYAVGAVVAIVVFSLLVMFFRTRAGVVLRAISDDYVASWSVGVSVERGIGVSWAISGVISTAAGVFWGATQGVDQSLSLLLLKGLTVAVLGGLDSIGGAVLASVLVGVFEAVASGYLDPLVGGGSRDLVMSIVLIVTILIRPHGLFGRHHIERI